MPQLGLQHTWPTLQVFLPQAVLVAMGFTPQSRCEHLEPGGAHVPQLALQHTRPSPHVASPQRVPAAGVPPAVAALACVVSAASSAARASPSPLIDPVAPSGDGDWAERAPLPAPASGPAAFGTAPPRVGVASAAPCSSTTSPAVDSAGAATTTGSGTVLVAFTAAVPTEDNALGARVARIAAPTTTATVRSAQTSHASTMGQRLCEA
jgi:hypothetical protein